MDKDTRKAQTEGVEDLPEQALSGDDAQVVKGGATLSLLKLGDIKGESTDDKHKGELGI